MNAQEHDFDSLNDNWDSNSTEFLDALKYLDIIFFSEQFIHKVDSPELQGTFDFNGKSVKKTVICTFIKKIAWRFAGILVFFFWILE